MSLWWLESGWKSATCACGANIWKSGGDPDMGRCHDCAMTRATEERLMREEIREHEMQLRKDYEREMAQQEPTE